MSFAVLSDILIQLFVIIHKVLDNGLISPFVSFGKGFALVIVLAIAIAFLLMSVFITMRQARRLPTSYSVEVLDVFSQNTTIEGLRVQFKTYDAAQSYAQLYRERYSSQYQFKVKGSYGAPHH